MDALVSFFRLSTCSASTEKSNNVLGTKWKSHTILSAYPATFCELQNISPLCNRDEESGNSGKQPRVTTLLQSSIDTVHLCSVVIVSKSVFLFFFAKLPGEKEKSLKKNKSFAPATSNDW